MLKNNPRNQLQEKFHVINGYQKQVGGEKKTNLFSPASKKRAHTQKKINKKIHVFAQWFVFV